MEVVREVDAFSPEDMATIAKTLSHGKKAEQERHDDLFLLRGLCILFLLHSLGARRKESERKHRK